MCTPSTLLKALAAVLNQASQPSKWKCNKLKWNAKAESDHPINELRPCVKLESEDTVEPHYNGRQDLMAALYRCKCMDYVT